MVDDETIVRILTEEVPDLIAVYRFGSTVDGTAREGSDVDVAILGRVPVTGIDRLRVAERLAGALRCDVDVVDLLRASTVLRMQVIGSGVALPMGDERRRGLFEDRVFSDYVRLNEERRAILEQVAREGTIHGR